MAHTSVSSSPDNGRTREVSVYKCEYEQQHRKNQQPRVPALQMAKIKKLDEGLPCDPQPPEFLNILGAIERARRRCGEPREVQRRRIDPETPGVYQRGDTGRKQPWIYLSQALHHGRSAPRGEKIRGLKQQVGSNHGQSCNESRVNIDPHEHNRRQKPPAPLDSFFNNTETTEKQRKENGAEQVGP